MGGKGSGAKKIAPEIRFFGLVEVNDCWEWKGRQTPDGYGRFWNGSKLVMAHRWVYEHLTQTELGELTIDHLCKNRLCENPDHMEPVTDEENRRRGGCRFASRIAQQRRTHCKRDLTTSSPRRTQSSEASMNVCAGLVSTMTSVGTTNGARLKQRK